MKNLASEVAVENTGQKILFVVQKTAADSTTVSGQTLDMGTIQFTTAGSGAARAILTGAPKNWAINDGGGI